MDNIGELMQPAGSAIQLQAQVRTSAKSSVAKTKLKTKQTLGKDEAKKPTAEEKYSLEIMPSSNSIKPTKIANTTDVTQLVQERLNLNSDCVVNGVANGLDLDLKHSMVLNGNSDSPSHCDNSEIFNGDVVDQTKSVASRTTRSPIDDRPSLTNTPALREERSSEQNDVEYVSYRSELQMPDIMRLIQKDLSEPYSIYTYRYFIHNWPKLCFLAMDGTDCVGAIVCKLDIHRKVVKRGYIAMLAVDEKYRKRKIGSHLVLKAIRAMVADDADEVVLETEITNRPALRLYENLGFVRDKRLFRYYLNGVDALRLKLWLR